MSDVNSQTVHSGHTIEIVYNGVVIGKIQGLDGERNFGTQGVYEIGSIMPKEHIPLRYEGSVNVERFFLRNSDLQKAGLASLGNDVLSKGIIDIVVRGKYASGADATISGARKNVDSKKSAYNSAIASASANSTNTSLQSAVTNTRIAYESALSSYNTLVASSAEVRTYHGCTIGSYRETFRVNAIAGENASFTYLYATSANLDASRAKG
jgi:hypothetical protein